MQMLKRKLPRFSNTFLAFVVIVIAAGAYVFGTKSSASTIMPSVTIGSAKLTYEEAKTSGEQEKGLGYRASLTQDHAMLFRFAAGTHPIFWMKGMQFPLDFIWIDQNKVVQIHEHIAAPPASLSDDQLPKVIPDVPVDALFEVNAGFVEYNKIKIGNNVEGL